MASEQVPAGKNPRDLIKQEDVQKALEADIGSSAQLKTFTVKDFTAKGDNYACFVTSVSVNYEKDGQKGETSYVVKLNPCRPHETMDEMAPIIFEKESGFYTKIAPLMNAELVRVNELPLRIPKHYHSVTVAKQEVIFLEDMRKYDYKMVDRKLGMDYDHTMLILRELARFHASSVLLMSNAEYKSKNFVAEFPFLEEFFTRENLIGDENTTGMEMWLSHSIGNAAEITEKNTGYEDIAKFLRSLIGKVCKVLQKSLRTEPPFVVLCHGDCWNNNFLFRYNEEGKPVECCLLDMQINRVASPSVDLNYMLYCSLNGNTRQENITEFFSTYYSTFATVLAADGQPMQFSVEELTQNFYSNNILGLIFAMALIPIILMDSDDAPDMSEFTDESMEKNLQDFKLKVMETVQKNPLLNSRFLCLFDEMREKGVFETVW